ncbi:MAG: adenylyltransferase/cytidyltransferase family protein [Bacteroidales bacterium]
MGKKFRIGYTMGVFDLFHIGHLNIIKNAKSLCDYLVVGVTTDERTKKIKGNLPIIPFEERLKIIESLKYVDRVVPKSSSDIKEDWNQIKFDLFVKGSDWEGTPKGKALEAELAKLGVKVEYFPYTKETSSSILKKAISKLQ